MDNNFIFRKEWRDAIFWLSDSMRLQIYDAIIAYGTSHKSPELSALLMRIFNVVKNDIDKEQEKKSTESYQNATGERDIPTENNNQQSEQNAAIIPDRSNEKIKNREQKFYEKLIPFFGKYGKEIVENFFRYWSEPNKSGTKMRFELEKTWDIERRLRTWNDNQKKYNNGSTTQFGTAAEQRAAATANLITGYLLDESD